ncbi:hypothetical protein AYO44_10060 [Planctomycetaceae bacterium SCGC AG-212-F19]|nr:hypothetical protein AYO44_10060 [Planctomycetaceae bacterium SCGC AG-212-F19]
MSILSDPEIVDVLKTKFVPVAVDQHDHRRRKDADGELFAKVLKQAGRSLDGMAQGFYLFTPDGKLLAFSNATSGPEMKRLIAQALKKFDPAADVERVEGGPKDPRFVYQPPEGGLVVRVTSKVLGGYDETKGGNTAIYQTALGRDHLWLRKDETDALARGDWPASVQSRLARFHLVDNTRGEPPFWRAEEIKQLDLALKDGRLTGSVHLETKSGERGYVAQFLGIVAAKDNQVTRFDLVAKGQFWGEGNFTRNAPKGKFPFAVALTLPPADDPGRSVPPGGARGNLATYLR